MASTKPDSNRPAASSKVQAKDQKKKIVDSWEDEDVSSDSDGGGVASTESTNWDDCPLPTLPPLTPSSPFASSTAVDTITTDPKLQSSPDQKSAQRPQKTDAVARRMIAGALGLKAPKQTEEQKAYERAIRDQERKRRDEERLMEQKRKIETEKARAAIWYD